MKRYLLSALTLSLIAGFSHAADSTGAAKAGAAASAKPASKALGSGIAVEYIDKSVRVQDDFFTHLNGKWLKDTEIPADKSSWGSFAKLRDDTQPQLLALIENSAKDPNKAAGTDAQRIGDFYASFMDEKKVEELGLAPLNAELAHIAALKDRAELPAMMAHLGRLGVNVPYDFGIHQDAKDSTKYVADISQGGLGMPDRDYYLKPDDAKLADARAKYQVHVERMLALAGSKSAAADARAIVDFETELAKVQWTKVENRDPVKTYNKVELAQMASVAPGYDWKAYLDDAGISTKTTYVIVSQPSYLKGFAELSTKTALETWKAYLQLHLIEAYANFLSKPFVDERFAFYGVTLSGVTQMQPRWKRAV
ncbi:MAG: peptidase, partial [Massilia sp.]|nr:peptidase [Massilia sp.]